jgi:hypothetical protein
MQPHRENYVLRRFPPSTGPSFGGLFYAPRLIQTLPMRSLAQGTVTTKTIIPVALGSIAFAYGVSKYAAHYLNEWAGARGFDARRRR